MADPTAHEPHPDPQALTSNADPTHNSKTGVDYEPHPSSSIPLTPARQKIVDSICALYSGSARDKEVGERDMLVYAEKAVYDDPWSYCDTRFKIAGQWYGRFIFLWVVMRLGFMKLNRHTDGDGKLEDYCYRGCEV